MHGTGRAVFLKQRAKKAALKSKRGKTFQAAHQISGYGDLMG
jgi:hypothetical protein